jgi:uncharacterized protein (DUF1800 family)
MTWSVAMCVALAGCGGGSGGETDTAPNTVPTAAPEPAPGASSATAETPDTDVSGILAMADAAAAAEATAQSAQRSMLNEAATASPSPEATAPSPAAVEATPAVITSQIAATPLTAEPADQTDATSTATTLVVRARAALAGGVGAEMVVRVNGQTIGTTIVSSTQLSSFVFPVAPFPAGSQVDVVFTNGGNVGGNDRSLFVAYVQHGNQVVMPNATNAVVDRGVGAAAFDGNNLTAGTGNLFWNGALRLTWPKSVSTDTTLSRKRDAVRFLLQASFGPTATDVAALISKPYATWISEQIAMPHGNAYLDAVQSTYELGDAWRPRGANYTPTTVGQTFWKSAATAPDQLRKRVAFALHQIFMVSQNDSNLWAEARAVAAYHDLLNKNAFGNFRQLMEDMTLSPAMGIYLSHMRNRKEDPATGRMPDENFARELMQLFTIGLYELNTDASLKRDTHGNPIETYGNADVMALAKVFTGWSWAFGDGDLTEKNFRWGRPVTSAAGDQRIDHLPMKPYPGQHSAASKTLFAGKPWAVTIPADGSAQADLKLALDALFNHPNVGPFISRQLIQRLVTSQPSPAYVARVAAVFNNNGSGVRGDLAALVRSILLDTEARDSAPAAFGKLREPVLRVAHWMRALGAQSLSGKWKMAWELDEAGQRALHAASVFGYDRPGYVPPNTSFATTGSTAPEFQLTNESSVAAWINTAESLAGSGLGWTGTTGDVQVEHATLGAMASGGRPSILADHLDLLLLGGRMPAQLRQSLLDTVASIAENAATTTAHRGRAAAFLVLASPQFVSQP